MNLIITTGFLSFLFSSPSNLASNAEMWEGKHYKRGQGARCADFVGYIVSKSGKTPPKGYQKCTAWLKWGKSVSQANLQKGDIIVYSKLNGYNHIGIYDGNGKIIHRPTRSKTVRKLDYKYRRILSIRRG
jgi:cell wall-associated NlpC family hydrolase